MVMGVTFDRNISLGHILSALVVIFSVLSFGYALKSTVQMNEARICRIEQQVTAFQALEPRMVRMETNVQGIFGTLVEIKEELRQQRLDSRQ